MSRATSYRRASSGQAEQAVGVDRVVAVRLERVRADLVGEADAAPLLPQVEDGAGAGVRDRGHRGVELLLAVALERAEDLARHALGVDAHEDVARRPRTSP